MTEVRRNLAADGHARFTRYLVAAGVAPTEFHSIAKLRLDAGEAVEAASQLE